VVTTPPEQAVPKNHAARFWSSKKRTNIIALLLMALATLGSSWSGFQASLWDGTQTFQLAEATKFKVSPASKPAIFPVTLTYRIPCLDHAMSDLQQHPQF
jgi:hypothetical protein